MTALRELVLLAAWVGLTAYVERETGVELARRPRPQVIDAEVIA